MFTYTETLFAPLFDCVFDVSHALLLNFFLCLSYASANGEVFGNFFVFSCRCWCFEWLRLHGLNFVAIVIVVLVNDVAVMLRQGKSVKMSKMRILERAMKQGKLT